MTNLNNLSDDNLAQVTGGMSCQDAIQVAKFYIALAGMLGGLGNSAGSAAASGKAQGLLQGACS
jgi:bacteriocin-like protein